MTYTKKLEILTNDVTTTIEIIVGKKGKDSNVGFKTVRIRNYDYQYNIEGTNDYVIEVGEKYLFSAQGLQYSFNCISIEELCELVDYIKELKIK